MDRRAAQIFGQPNFTELRYSDPQFLNGQEGFKKGQKLVKTFHWARLGQPVER